MPKGKRTRSRASQEARERRRIRRTLEALLEGAAGRGLAAHECTHAHRLRESARSWARDPSIQGFAIAHRKRNGRVTPELVLKVYVDRKLRRETVGNLVPRQIRLSPRHKPVRTDVEGVGVFRLNAHAGRLRPACPGAGISLRRGSAGTLGCLLRKRGDRQKLYILSCAHVLAEGGAPPGSAIYQPASETGAHRAATDIIARLSEVYPRQATDEGFPNLADAAIAEVTNPAAVGSEIPGIGVPRGAKLLVRPGEPVKMAGFRTEAGVSIIESVEFATEDVSTGERYGYRDLVICDPPMSQAGDSGAAVLSADGLVVGVLMGSFDDRSVFARIRPILEQLDAEIVTERL
jgi:hypothetical protein